MNYKQNTSSGQNHMECISAHQPGRIFHTGAQRLRVRFRTLHKATQSGFFLALRAQVDSYRTQKTDIKRGHPFLEVYMPEIEIHV